MHKYSIAEVPTPISLLFRTNITYHEHNARSTISVFIFPLTAVKLPTKPLAIVVSIFGITYL